MKKNDWLLYLIPALGVPACVLRAMLYRTAVDSRGLLVPMHPMAVAVWALAAVAALLTVVCVWKRRGSENYEGNFGRSIPAGIGSIVMALGLAAVLMGDRSFDILILARLGMLLGVGSAVCLVWAGVCRIRGRMPFWGGYAVTAVYFALDLILRYRPWSSDPQFQDYAFSLFGGICLLLFSYYQTAFCVGMGRRRMQLAVGLLGSFCCIAAAYGTDTVLWLSGAVYMITNLCRLSPAEEKEEE